MDRYTGEAHHIIDIQEDLGISFNAVGGEEVQRVMEMEDRDRREKLAWEQSHETKMEAFPVNFVQGLWGNNDCEWAFLPSEGNSGGLLSIWNKVKANLVFTFIGEGFVGVCLDLVGETKRCYIVNVYAKCDFNSVRDTHERIGVLGNLDGQRSSEMVSFDLFLNNIELVDMPLI
ncbi:putative reverse transcriptase - beet retrotransposon, partial [Trifolium medium]|nr:putative reverse transcriptase - beet retrotransposon [Trifolium medium]